MLHLTTCPDCAGPTRLAFDTTEAYVACRRCGHVHPNAPIVVEEEDRRMTAQEQADALARVTGSVQATVTYDRRLPSGEIVVEETATSAPVVKGAPRRVSPVVPCELHPAFEADYCPSCGTSTRIGD